MKKLFLLVLFGLLSGCASIGQVEGTSNVAEINKVILPDSSNIYIISWKGHTYIYNPPFVTEINP